MLITLVQAKAYLGIADNSYDTFLNEQIEIISDSIECHCQRKFLTATYIQTFYEDDFNLEYSMVTQLPLAHFPIKTMTSLKDEIGNDIEYRIEKESGMITNTDGFFVGNEELIATFEGGYDTVPSPIKSVIYSLIEDRYAKKLRGISMAFGQDVQSVSIPGAISIAFDYSLQANELNTDFGMILGNHLNVLSRYRSEKSVVGDVRKIYV
jgi:hypothetical protein